MKKGEENKMEKNELKRKVGTAEQRNIFCETLNAKLPQGYKLQQHKFQIPSGPMDL